MGVEKKSARCLGTPPLTVTPPPTGASPPPSTPLPLGGTLLMCRQASLLDLGPVPPSTESLIGLLRKTSLAISTPTSPSAPALVPALPCPTWSTTSSSPPGGAPLSPQPPATLAPHPRTRQRSTAPA